ncbi:sensor domain-containing diguanylate cyclase [uncultured Aquitalea sp.]|uniref:sensor domain-containing diguanylate cyclase n=1 Tax=uncultured Aquitalea sp. TaxID=540272 RepID=UPI0025CC9FF6|nr:sensor domain-containing diguanylate cyclase [uncultured Aquitalea sp.]
MPKVAFDVLDALNTPVWVILPQAGRICFANTSARKLVPNMELQAMRDGIFSAHAHSSLLSYTPEMLTREQIVEIWTVSREGKPAPLSCRLSAIASAEEEYAIVAEGILGAPLSGVCLLPDEGSFAGASAETRFYEMLFRTNTAPMLLIDPEQNGRILDANEAATRFYGYSRETFCTKHTWDINALGKDILPVMREVAKLPGGHKPLSFAHILADGSQRDVQTYAGPVELDGRRLMLCVVHDITEQKRLESELERAALRDPLTGLWNRRHLLLLLEQARQQKQLCGIDYSILLVDADHFKRINDEYGHFIGDEVLQQLASTFENRVRAADAVCRWGGEEFVILLPHTDETHAVFLAEFLRQTVEQLRHPELPPLTVSIGVAQHLDDESTESLIMRVDRALYTAKARGRNAVVAAQDCG